MVLFVAFVHKSANNVLKSMRSNWCFANIKHVVTRKHIQSILFQRRNSAHCAFVWVYSGGNGINYSRVVHTISAIICIFIETISSEFSMKVSRESFSIL